MDNNKRIRSFDDFGRYSLLIERLHINNEIDSISDEIWMNIQGSTNQKHVFYDLPYKLNISKLIINIQEMKSHISGQLDLNKSKSTKGGWIIHIDLTNGFTLDILKHELNHALRLTLVGKDQMIKNLNHIKAQNIFAIYKDNAMDYFFYLMYLANDEEINAKVIETGGFIKETMNKWGVDKLTNSQFHYIILSSDAWRVANQLINFKCDEVFKNWPDNKLNKLLYILEENKGELDRIHQSKFSKLKLIIKAIRDIFRNNTGFNLDDHKIYHPKRGKKFYDQYITKQGHKLKKRIMSLYDHYQ